MEMNMINTGSMEAVGIALAGFLMIFLIGIFLLLIIMYVLGGIGLYRIGKRENSEYSFLAWIPILNFFYMVYLSEKRMPKELQGKFTIAYGIVYGINIFLGEQIIIIPILSSVMFIYAFYKLASGYTKSTTMHLVISIVTLGVSIPIQLFFLRNNEVVEGEQEEVTFEEGSNFKTVATREEEKINEEYGVGVSSIERSVPKGVEIIGQDEQEKGE